MAHINVNSKNSMYVISITTALLFGCLASTDIGLFTENIYCCITVIVQNAYKMAKNAGNLG